MLGPRLKRLFCSHREEVLKVEGDRLFTECISCLHKSNGISTQKAYVESRRVSTDAINRILSGAARGL